MRSSARRPSSPSFFSSDSSADGWMLASTPCVMPWSLATASSIRSGPLRFALDNVCRRRCACPTADRTTQDRFCRLASNDGIRDSICMLLGVAIGREPRALLNDVCRLVRGEV